MTLSRSRVLVAAVIAALLAVTASAYGATTHNTMQSGNWFGYTKTFVGSGGPFTGVTGSWVVPTVTQHTAGQPEHASVWIGIGGGCLEPNCVATDYTLIQTGIEADVAADGSVTYGAWWEAIPAPVTPVSLTVRPGDRIFASIRPGLTSEVWKLTLTNRTAGQSWRQTVDYPSVMGTAEWIVETPLLVGGGGADYADLPDLTEVRFDRATVNGENPHFTRQDKMLLVVGGDVVGRPSNPQPDGNGFGACTYAARCPVPASR